MRGRRRWHDRDGRLGGWNVGKYNQNQQDGRCNCGTKRQLCILSKSILPIGVDYLAAPQCVVHQQFEPGSNPFMHSELEQQHEWQQQVAKRLLSDPA